jgi:hypothetical protein
LIIVETTNTINEQEIEKPHYSMDTPHNLVATQVIGPTIITIIIIDLKDLSMQEEGE